jgi:hypothetical protein
LEKSLAILETASPTEAGRFVLKSEMRELSLGFTFSRRAPSVFEERGAGT